MNKGSPVLDEIRRLIESKDPRASQVRRIAEIIRAARQYRWVGIYEVDGDQIAMIAWTGPREPAYPRFSVSQGLCGAAIRSGAAVLVADVTKDRRYLTTFGSTRSEIVVPIPPSRTKEVLSVIDVESERLDVFTEKDRLSLEDCASLLASHWESKSE